MQTGNDLLLQVAGGLAIVIAIIHGVLAETRVFPATSTRTPALKLLLRLVWQASTVAWISFGILVIAAVRLDAGGFRTAVLLIALANFGFAAAGNFVATRGRHPGWLLCSLVVGIIGWVFLSA